MSYGHTSSCNRGYTDLVYLRARQYSPSTGRFLTRDTWDGNYRSPISYNRWLYAHGNPLMYTDPSGNCIFGLDCPVTIPLILILIATGILTTGCSSDAPVASMPTLKNISAITDRPVIMTSVFGVTSSSNKGPSEYDQLLSFGDTSQDRAGIEISANISFPSEVVGSLEWVQNGNVRIEYVSRTGEIGGYYYDDQWYVDSGPIYPIPGVANISPGAEEFKFTTEDSPSVPLFGSKVHATIKQKYRMYLMWRPKGVSDNQRIPLARVDWGWSATAVNNGEAKNIGGFPYEFNDWNLTEHVIDQPKYILDTNLLKDQMPILSPTLGFTYRSATTNP